MKLSMRQKEVLVLMDLGRNTDQDIAAKLLHWDFQSEFDRFIDRLVARKLVRQKDNGMIYLTDAGRECVAAALEEVRALWRDRDGFQYLLSDRPARAQVSGVACREEKP